MAGKLERVRSFLSEKVEKLASNQLFANVAGSRSSRDPSTRVGDDSLDPHPSVGFRVTFNPSNGRLTVHVVAARHLPAHVARIPVVSYFVKVKLYPGKEKFETDKKPESWPTFNQHFNFPLTALQTSHDPLDTVLTSSKFLTFTVFAVDTFDKRKSVGSATWALDAKQFVEQRYPVRQGVTLVETPELWRKVVDISSGFSTLTGAQQKRIIQRAKDQLELTLCHTPGEVGEDDILTFRVDRLRWGIEKTKEYQHKKADMYVKLSVTNCFGQVMRCMKTQFFAPSISVHWPKGDPKGVLQVSVPPLGPRNKGYRCVATLCAKFGKAGKKVRLGRAEIHQKLEEPELDSDHWILAMKSAGEPVSQWHNLLDQD